MNRVLRTLNAALSALLVGMASLPAGAQELPLVKILATGGTIANVYDAARGGWVPALRGEDLVKALPDLNRLAHRR